MATYPRMRPQETATVSAAHDKAQTLTDKLIARLNVKPPAEKYQKLLSDCFGIPVPLWNTNAAKAAADAGLVRSALQKVRTRMQGTTILFEANPPAAAADFAAYTMTGLSQYRIFLTSRFFLSNYRQAEQAGYLVHEYIHLCHYPGGHPGAGGESLAIIIGRNSLGIPMPDAANNAYCYQYLIQWLG